MSEIQDAAAGQLEERKDLPEGDVGLFQYWAIQEAIAEREERSWRKEGLAIIRRYRDERSQASKTSHRFNILWSNVQTLKPALYGRMPKADCQRRFKDQDDVGRLASELLERSLNYCLENYGFDGSLRASVEDMLLPGRGTVRVLYVPHFGDPITDPGAQGDEEGEAETVANAGDSGAQPGSGDNSPDIPGKGDNGVPVTPGTPNDSPQPEAAADIDSDDAQPPAPEREVVWEEARFKYLAWDDYREGPARQWDEVPWVRYRAYMTRDELRARFGKEKADRVSLDYTPKGAEKHEEDGAPPDAYKKAIVFEYWDKSKKEAVWLAPGTPDLVLDQLDDPLRLRNFFPNPDPLLATTTTDRRIPVPDYHEYQDQADELDTLSGRIERLQRSLKVFGLYPGEEKQALSNLISDGDNEKLLIPIDDWQAIVDKGGMEGMIQWFPIKEIAEALIQLYNARDRAKAILYEVTGIADIIRGATAPEETATAQQLKSQFATLRLSERQKMVARMARELIRLAADVIGNHFSARTIGLMTGYPQLLAVPDQPHPPAMPPEMQIPPPVTTTTMMGHNGGPAMPQQQPPSPAVQQYQMQLQAFQQAMQQYQQVLQANEGRQRQFDAAVQLIKEDVLNDFRIDIEADSTIAIDEQQEQQARTQFLEQFIPMLEQIVPFAQGNVPMAELAKEVSLFAVRGFKTARSLEETIEKAFDAIAKMPPNPKVSGQDPKAKGGSDAGEMAMAQAHEHDSQLDAQTAMHDTDTKAQAAMQANAIKLRQVEGTLALGERKLALQANNDTIKNALAHDKATSEQALRDARTLSISSRSASGLV